MRHLPTALLLAAVACGDAGDATTHPSSTSAATEPGTGDAPTTSSNATTDAPTTGGATGSATGDATTGGSTGDDPFSGETVCSRGLSWDMGNTESPFMNPGMACLTCHAAMEPFLSNRILVGGTVYETGHEPDRCFGIDGVKDPMFVEITDANAVVTQLEVNQGGNFLWDKAVHGSLAFPITARVVRGDEERVMLTPQMDGDCNRCHTEDGANAAPGRIVAP